MRTFIKIFLLTFSLISTAFSAEKPAPELEFDLDQATKQIITENNYKVLGAKTDIIEGKKTHVIKVLTEDGRVQNLKIDAETGTIINKSSNK